MAICFFRLLRAATEALVPGSKDYLDIVDSIAQDHLVAARLHIRNLLLLDEAEKHVNQECDILKRFLGAAEVCVEMWKPSGARVVLAR
ncbi:MAG: hypothetical protein BJ554DRAFT_2626 [Olpidium bornovanus]|uniref:Uncharacterized protein n=1 Tax=Olpidium bornovanus TaxID=278681 RepID=A0A8H7ZQ80_9FUNG|nr:MAG: hypothetical protein BJ554DRAFT_2626 [Olpidium bornovanus]